MTSSMAEATRKGSMPMSMRRVIAPGASLVWRVENTKWPVSEARMAMSAVSRSRISPTMMTSGSWRSTWRRALAKVRPISGRTCIWFAPGTSYSMGSSTVTMRRSVELIWRRKALSEVDLPEPVGPVTSMMPCGYSSTRVICARSASSMPRRSMV